VEAVEGDSELRNRGTDRLMEFLTGGLRRLPLFLFLAGVDMAGCSTTAFWGPHSSHFMMVYDTHTTSYNYSLDRVYEAHHMQVMMMMMMMMMMIQS